MRIPSVSLTVAIASVSVGLLAGCSGSGSSGTPTVMPGNATQAQSHVRSQRGLDATGVAPRFYSLLHLGNTARHVRPDSCRPVCPPKDLAVSDFGTGAVEVLDKSYTLEQTITNGLNGPDGDWYDKHENLYVANYAGITVQEYDPDSTGPPSFTYTANLSDPINVTTDASANVYVADYGFGGASVVVVYPQKSNTPSAVCSTGLANEGLAIDNTNGKLFVSGNNPNTGSANIIEYNLPLSSNCSGTTLTPTLGFAGGMQIDKHGNLLAIDQFVGVDVIPPPYTSIASTCGSGYSDPFHDALNKQQGLLFVADVGNANVQVLNYPACTTNHSPLGSGNGLSDPAGVAANTGKG